MMIDEADFSLLAKAFGARSAVIRRLDDLDHIEKWVR
jgi:hypothetical protein